MGPVIAVITLLEELTGARSRKRNSKLGVRAGRPPAPSPERTRNGPIAVVADAA
jgi:hypothetical protein